MTFGAYCGSSRMTSARIALRRASPSMQQRRLRVERAVAQHRVGSGLPDDQIGLFIDDAGVEARQHVARLLAVDAAVQDRDIVPQKMLGQLGLEPARIVGLGRAGAGSGGRRGADGHDLDRAIAFEMARDARERIVQAILAGQHFADRMRLRRGGRGLRLGGGCRGRRRRLRQGRDRRGRQHLGRHRRCREGEPDCRHRRHCGDQGGRPSKLLLAHDLQ